MADKFRDLYFTPKDNTIYWVVGYMHESNVIKFTEQLQTKAKEFAEHVGVPYDSVRSLEVDSSRRFKTMRVFYADTESPHDDAFIMDDRYMLDHLRD